MNTYIYKLKNAIYINLSNRCTNDCSFCVRNNHDGVGGYHLLMDKEPSTEQIISLLEKEEDVSRIVFCGLGEPTTAIDVLIPVAQYLKKRGAQIRLNTNGQGSAYAGRDIAKELSGLVDTVSISLNAPDAKEYQKICKSMYGERAFAHMLAFAQSCIANGIDTVLSVVDVIGPDNVAACSAIAKKTGARFRVRTYVE